MFLPGCGCKACYHSEMSSKSLWRRAAPLGTEPHYWFGDPQHFAGTTPQAGAGGSRGDTSHQVLSPSACLGSEATAQSHYFIHYTQFIWEALLHTAFNKRALTMHSSLMSTHSGREALRGFSLQGSHREQRGKRKVIQEKFYCVLLLKKSKSLKYFGYLQVLCLYVGIERKIELQKWELWVPEQLCSSLQYKTVSKMRSSTMVVPLHKSLGLAHEM